MNNFNYIFILILIIGLLSTSSCTNNRYSYLEGLWVGEYSCFNDDINEIVVINLTKNGVVAIKKTGDLCVAEGDTTWFGVFEHSGIQIYINGYYPALKKNIYNKAELLEINKNEFEIKVKESALIHFTRK